MEQNELDSWGGFLGSGFLSASEVKGEDHEFVCVNTEFDEINNRPILNLESAGMKVKFSLNVTNSTFLKDAKIGSPKEVIGKKITFKKVMVNNPQTHKEVEGLRIKSVN